MDKVTIKDLIVLQDSLEIVEKRVSELEQKVGAIRGWINRHAEYHNSSTRMDKSPLDVWREKK